MLCTIVRIIDFHSCREKKREWRSRRQCRVVHCIFLLLSGAAKSNRNAQSTKIKLRNLNLRCPNEIIICAEHLKEKKKWSEEKKKWIKKCQNVPVPSESKWSDDSTSITISLNRDNVLSILPPLCYSWCLGNAWAFSIQDWTALAATVATAAAQI